MREWGDVQETLAPPGTWFSSPAERRKAEDLIRADKTPEQSQAFDDLARRAVVPSSKLLSWRRDELAWGALLFRGQELSLAPPLLLPTPEDCSQALRSRLSHFPLVTSWDVSPLQVQPPAQHTEQKQDVKSVLDRMRQVKATFNEIWNGHLAPRWAPTAATVPASGELGAEVHRWNFPLLVWNRSAGEWKFNSMHAPWWSLPVDCVVLHKPASGNTGPVQTYLQALCYRALEAGLTQSKNADGWTCKCTAQSAHPLSEDACDPVVLLLKRYLCLLDTRERPFPGHDDDVPMYVQWLVGTGARFTAPAASVTAKKKAAAKKKKEAEAEKKKAAEEEEEEEEAGDEDGGAKAPNANATATKAGGLLLPFPGQPANARVALCGIEQQLCLAAQIVTHGVSLFPPGLVLGVLRTFIEEPPAALSPRPAAIRWDESEDFYADPLELELPDEVKIDSQLDVDFPDEVAADIHPAHDAAPQPSPPVGQPRLHPTAGVFWSHSAGPATSATQRKTMAIQQLLERAQAKPASKAAKALTGTTLTLLQRLLQPPAARAGSGLMVQLGLQVRGSDEKEAGRFWVKAAKCNTCAPALAGLAKLLLQGPVDTATQDLAVWLSSDATKAWCAELRQSQDDEIKRVAGLWNEFWPEAHALFIEAQQQGPSLALCPEEAPFVQVVVQAGDVRCLEPWEEAVTLVIDGRVRALANVARKAPTLGEQTLYMNCNFQKRKDDPTERRDWADRAVVELVAYRREMQAPWEQKCEFDATSYHHFRRRQLDQVIRDLEGFLQGKSQIAFDPWDCDTKALATADTYTNLAFVQERLLQPVPGDALWFRVNLAAHLHVPPYLEREADDAEVGKGKKAAKKKSTTKKSTKKKETTTKNSQAGRPSRAVPRAGPLEVAPTNPATHLGTLSAPATATRGEARSGAWGKLPKIWKEFLTPPPKPCFAWWESRLALAILFLRLPTGSVVGAEGGVVSTFSPMKTRSSTNPAGGKEKKTQKTKKKKGGGADNPSTARAAATLGALFAIPSKLAENTHNATLDAAQIPWSDWAHLIVQSDPPAGWDEAGRAFFAGTTLKDSAPADGVLETLLCVAEVQWLCDHPLTKMHDLSSAVKDATCALLAAGIVAFPLDADCGKMANAQIQDLHAFLDCGKLATAVSAQVAIGTWRDCSLAKAALVPGGTPDPADPLREHRDWRLRLRLHQQRVASGPLPVSGTSPADFMEAQREDPRVSTARGPHTGNPQRRVHTPLPTCGLSSLGRHGLPSPWEATPSSAGLHRLCLLAALWREVVAVVYKDSQPPPARHSQFELSLRDLDGYCRMLLSGDHSAGTELWQPLARKLEQVLKGWAAPPHIKTLPPYDRFVPISKYDEVAETRHACLAAWQAHEWFLFLPKGAEWENMPHGQG